MKAQVISFRCVLKNMFGRILSSTVNCDIVNQVHGSGLLSALAEGLQDLRAGERRSISLRADQAYGFYDPKKSFTRTREELRGADGLKIGDLVKMQDSSYRVVEIMGDTITFDGNHPFAGQDLVFEIEALMAREATPDDLIEPVEESANHLH